MQTQDEWRASAGTRVPRPTRVERCPLCGDALVTNYPDCPACFSALESYLLADWAALLERESVAAGTPDETLLAQVVLQETDRHPWTVVNIAMTLLTCSTCGHELGSRYTECGECGMAFGSAITAEYKVPMYSHSLHVGRFVLRHPHQHSANSIMGWRLSMPRVLTGWIPTTQQAQRYGDLIKAGRVDEVHAELTALDTLINHRNNQPDSAT